MLQTIRLDSTDVDKVRSVLKKYATLHQGTKFLLSQEGATPEDAVKYHIQGWAYHTETAKAFSQYISRHFPDLNRSKKSLAEMEKPPSYIPYIIHNDNKQPIQYDKLVTNYTLDEVTEFQRKYQWIEQRPHKLKKKDIRQKFNDYVFERLSEEAVEDGIIQYQKVMTVFMKYYTPTKIGTNPRRMKDVLDGYTWRLEQKYPKNNRLRNRYYNDMCRLDDDLGIYKTNTFSYLKLELDNKNGGESDTEHGEDDSDSEGVSPPSTPV